jgi:hypothetical protein
LDAEGFFSNKTQAERIHLAITVVAQQSQKHICACAAILGLCLIRNIPKALQKVV